MYPIPAPVPRIHRVLAIIQGSIATLSVIAITIWSMAAGSSSGSGSSTATTSDVVIAGFVAATIVPVVFQIVLLFFPLIGLAVFVARGSLAARVSSCCIWGVYLMVGLFAVQIHPAFVIVMLVALCMLIALAFADRLAASRTVPPAPGTGVPSGPGTGAPSGPYPTGQFPTVPPQGGGVSGSR